MRFAKLGPNKSVKLPRTVLSRRKREIRPFALLDLILNCERMRLFILHNTILKFINIKLTFTTKMDGQDEKYNTTAYRVNVSVKSFVDCQQKYY